MLRISLLILVTWLSLHKTILHILVFTKSKPKRSWSDPRFWCRFFFSVHEFILLSDAIWWHRSGSVLVQVITRCLVAPSHYLTQYWPIIRSTVIHLRAILQDLPKTSITKFSFKVIYHFRPLKYYLSTTKYYFTPLFHIRYVVETLPYPVMSLEKYTIICHVKGHTISTDTHSVSPMYEQS